MKKKRSEAERREALGGEQRGKEKKRGKRRPDRRKRNMCMKVPTSLKRNGKSILCKHGSATPPMLLLISCGTAVKS